MDRLSILDVIVVAALAAVVAVPIGTVFAVQQQEVQNRVNCARNLLQIGRALMLYSNVNRGQYPRTVYKADEAPVWGTPYQASKEAAPKEGADPYAAGPNRPADNDVTAALFQLLRTQNIRPNVFVCPSTRLRPLDFGERSASHYTNWRGNASLAAHLSYSYQNAYASRAAVATGFKFNNSISAEFAMMADMNPGGEALTTLDLRAIADEMPAGNSLNHNREGQNVLYGDGHIDWQSSPFVGVRRDNIYTANGPEVDGRANPAAVIVASPADAEDSILLPTAADIGQEIEPADAAAQPDGGPGGRRD